MPTPDGQPQRILFPTYQAPVLNPTGIPVAHPKTAAFLLKAAKSLGKLAMPRMKKGLQSRQSVKIRKRKQKFY